MYNGKVDRFGRKGDSEGSGISINQSDMPSMYQQMVQARPGPVPRSFVVLTINKSTFSNQFSCLFGVVKSKAN
jgi:hypothetical protein